MLASRLHVILRPRYFSLKLLIALPTVSTATKPMMDGLDADQRPAKKRRFFVEDSPEPERTSSSTTSPLNDVDAFSTANTTPQETLLEPNSSQTDLSLHNGINGTGPDASAGFDKRTFESFVGDKVAPATFERLREVSGNNMERAINMYLDGSWAIATAPPAPGASSSSITNAFNSRLPERNMQQHRTEGRRTSNIIETQKAMDKMPDYRYVGAFGVGAWATRSGTGLIQMGEAIQIERTKIKAPTKVGRGGKATQTNAARMRGDVVVRFTNSRGEEVGRLPKDTANWVSTLMDQKVCRFDGVCFLAPERIRVNDTIELQLRCSLLRRAFEASGFQKPEDNRPTGFFEEKETSDEKNLRLRQVAMVKLFDEVNLHPTTVNDTTARHKRQGILKAAEIAEQYDKEKESKKPKSTQDGGSTSPEDEEEDGKELEQDQLDSLYKKAQSFDFDTPAREPADTFIMDLRKYQKQALHWMISKEKNEKIDDKEVSMHPLWEEYTWPVKDMDDQDVPNVANQSSFYINPYSGELSLDFPLQEQHCLGGILADGMYHCALLHSIASLNFTCSMLTSVEMGLGKTIEMLSLMHSHRSDISMEASSAGPSSVTNLPRLPKNSASVEPAPSTTLVVAPMSLLAQWESESVKASKPGTLKAMVYYGSEKAANLQNLCCEANAASAPNLIITSYGVILSEFNQVTARGGDRGSHGGLFSLDFFRVILDEAHFIKNRQSKTAKACYEISAQHRWVLTGTPIVNVFTPNWISIKGTTIANFLFSAWRISSALSDSCVSNRGRISLSGRHLLQCLLNQKIFYVPSMSCRQSSSLSSCVVLRT